MKFNNTTLNDAFIIEPTIFKDNRGHFYESFRQNLFNEYANKEILFVQENQSKSHKNVFRGFHFQTGLYEQAKLVRVVLGTVIDIIIDLREDSSTYLKHFMIELSDINHKMLFVPRGFAHGFLVTSDVAVFQYKCDNYYNKEHESGLNPFDPILDINWPIEKSELIINEKDLLWKYLKN